MVARAKPTKCPSQVMGLSFKHQSQLLVRDFRAEAQEGGEAPARHPVGGSCLTEPRDT